MNRHRPRNPDRHESDHESDAEPLRRTLPPLVDGELSDGAGEPSESLLDFDRELAKAMREWECDVESPGEDRVRVIVGDTQEHPDATSYRRIRRSVSRVLWLALFLMALFGGISLLALAYRNLLGY
ncbi:MAG: hypothetical protein AAF517_20045 [Planctomycetota bacterium]